MTQAFETKGKDTMTFETIATGKPPIARIRVGSITASIWERQGKKRPFHTVTFERSYKNAQGEWQAAQSYDPATLAQLRVAAKLAHEKVLELVNSGA